METQKSQEKSGVIFWEQKNKKVVEKTYRNVVEKDPEPMFIIDKPVEGSDWVNEMEPLADEKKIKKRRMMREFINSDLSIAIPKPKVGEDNIGRSFIAGLDFKKWKEAKGENTAAMPIVTQQPSTTLENAQQSMIDVTPVEESKVETHDLVMEEEANIDEDDLFGGGDDN